jgi:hypothetical protein
MGDKCYELNALKAGPLRFAKALLGHESEKAMAGGKNCTSDGHLELDDAHAQAYFSAATAEVNAILAEHAGRGVPAEPDHDATQWAGERPTLIIMSDEVAVLDALRAHDGSKVFRLVHTANAKLSALEHGFSPQGFLSSSMADRVRSTRPMVRDMELLSRHAGGLVVRRPQSLHAIRPQTVSRTVHGHLQRRQVRHSLGTLHAAPYSNTQGAGPPAGLQGDSGASDDGRRVRIV